MTNTMYGYQVLDRKYAKVDKERREILRTVWCPSWSCDGQNKSDKPINKNRAFSNGFNKGFS